MKFLKNKFFVFTLIFIIMLTLIIIHNKHVVITNILYKNNKLPSSFNGYKILQVSDLHNAEFGRNQKTLIEKTIKSDPDIIFITGDFIDSYSTNIDISMEYIKGIINIAPIYYVTGNHESRIDNYKDLKEKLKKYGVNVLDNKATKLKLDSDFIALIGIDDPAFLKDEDNEVFKNIITDLSNNIDCNFKILLSHRPEKFDIYETSNIDLVFSGHAHGGQFRFPFVGGVLAPSQGFFPKYSSGLYTKGSTSMIVSRGIGNSVFPFRINNPPELILVTLEK